MSVPRPKEDFFLDQGRPGKGRYEQDIQGVFPKTKTLIQQIKDTNPKRFTPKQAAEMITGRKRFEYQDLEALADSFEIPIHYDPERCEENEGYAVAIESEPEQETIRSAWQVPKKECRKGITLNPHTNPKFQKWILAHEIGHMILWCVETALGKAIGRYAFISETEAAADRIADHMILPSETIKKENKDLDITRLLEMSERLQLPVETILRQFDYRIKNRAIAYIAPLKRATGFSYGIALKATPKGWNIPIWAELKDIGTPINSINEMRYRETDRLSKEETIKIIRRGKEVTLTTTCEYKNYKEGGVEHYLLGITLPNQPIKNFL